MNVANKVELYLGKFTEDMKGIERWVQITHNDRGDYWAIAWIKPPPWSTRLDEYLRTDSHRGGQYGGGESGTRPHRAGICLDDGSGGKPDH